MKGKNDLHRVLDKCHHVSHFQRVGGNAVCADPDYEEYGDILNEVHYGHLHYHYAVNKKIHARQFPVNPVKTLLFVFLRSERAYHHQAVKRFPSDSVQFVDKLLDYFEFGHRD